MIKLPTTPGWVKGFAAEDEEGVVLTAGVAATRDILKLKEDEDIFSIPDTLENAKVWLAENVNKGVRCPCCQQFAKLYRRPLYATMARMLILFYKIPGSDDWLHINDVIRVTGCSEFRCGDWAKLKHWALIEDRKKEEDDDKKNSGFWRITPTGKAFVERKYRIKSHILLYDGNFCGFEGEDVYIDHCLGKNFSYGELLGDADG